MYKRIDSIVQQRARDKRCKTTRYNESNITRENGNMLYTYVDTLKSTHSGNA